MSEHQESTRIPPLTEQDFSDAELELLTQDESTALSQLQIDNPVLARRILIASYFESADAANPYDIHQAIREHRILVLAIQKALARTRALEASPQNLSDDVASSRP